MGQEGLRDFVNGHAVSDRNGPMSAGPRRTEPPVDEGFRFPTVSLIEGPIEVFLRKIAHRVAPREGRVAVVLRERR